ncbi:MAG: NlpC/P60 family protein [Desulfobacterales bacterium]|nr:NlpC/P60 family protein [Desulfobacterales bacterium]
MKAKSNHPWKFAQQAAACAMLLLLMLSGCGGQARLRPEPPPAKPKPVLPALRYTIQAGAFKKIDNAVRLTQRLLGQKLSAYHFIDDSGFYKVRIGNFPSRAEAVDRAERLKAARVVDEYFIIAPEDYAATRRETAGEAQLRAEIIRTAERFIGVPYQWGGESTVSGFDCSGLTMVVYQLNGLDLPRTSREQWAAGNPVDERNLSKGDLVFFATRGGRNVSHVGIYLGDDRFLHAPRRGNAIQVASLAGDYYRTRYLGGRSYF